MLLRLLSRIFGAAALASLCLACWLLWRAQEEEPAFLVEGQDQVLCHVVPDRDYDVSFRIHNRTGAPIRVVGAAFT
jgi:hypothetical protein